MADKSSQGKGFYFILENDLHREMRDKSLRPCLNAGGVFLQQFTLDLKNAALIPHGALVSLAVCEFPNSKSFFFFFWHTIDKWGEETTSL